LIHVPDYCAHIFFEIKCVHVCFKNWSQVRIILFILFYRFCHRTQYTILHKINYKIGCMAGITTQRLLVRSPITGFQNIKNTSINNNRQTDWDMNKFSNMIDGQVTQWASCVTLHTNRLKCSRIFGIVNFLSEIIIMFH
jgi:hypothetical protein